MIEDLMPLAIPPGLFANGTKFQAKGRWNDGNLVRFHEGTKRPIGGWLPNVLTGDAITGTAHAAISWLLGDGTPLFAVGTETGLWVIDNNEVAYNVTPTTGHAAPYNWQLSLFGTYLIAVNSLLGDDDLSACNIFEWTGNTAAVAVAAFTTAVGPTGVYAAFATPERFLVMLRGKDPSGDPARGGIAQNYSERRVYWPSQESLDTVVSTSLNTAGDFDLTTDGRLIFGAAARGQSLLWTDVDLWTMTYIGGDLIYSFANVGSRCGIVSKRAAVLLDKGAFWMGYNKFFMYDGFVRSLSCEVLDKVFGDFNQSAANTVWAFANTRFNEVTWFYPSSLATSPDRYVTYNYEENHWTFGAMRRSCGVPQRFRHDIIHEPVPVMFDGAFMWNHETGQVREGQAYLTSGPIQLDTGQRLMRLQGIVPDDGNVGDVNVTLFSAMEPDALETIDGPHTLAAYTALRRTARQVRVKLTETAYNDWRVGEVRLAVRAAERRGVASGVAADNTPASLLITPDALTLISGEHYTYTAYVLNAAGQVLPQYQPDVWTSSNTAEVTIDDTGTVTVLVAPATVNITAELTAFSLTSNTAVLTVPASGSGGGSTRAPARIVIQSTLTSELGEVDALAYTVYDAYGVALTGVAPTSWTSADTAKATVDSSGNVTGEDYTGSTNVFAHLSGIVSNACVVSLHTQMTLHTFDTPGSYSFVVTSGSANAEVLCVGGGGGGADLNGGGGAAAVTNTAFAIAPGTIGLVVGAGGAGGMANGVGGGSSSVGSGGGSVVAGGGGGAGASSFGGTSGTLNIGGTAAGANDNNANDDGAGGGPSGGGAGGGGGGAGSRGLDAHASGTGAGAGAAGAGVVVGLHGHAASPFGGGGGGGASAFGVYGTGTTSAGQAGGGSGAFAAVDRMTLIGFTNGNPAAPNSGSGGGGGGSANGTSTGGDGGSGFVIIAYRTRLAIAATGGTITTVTL